MAGVRRDGPPWAREGRRHHTCFFKIGRVNVLNAEQFVVILQPLICLVDDAALGNQFDAPCPTQRLDNYFQKVWLSMI